MKALIRWIAKYYVVVILFFICIDMIFSETPYRWVSQGAKGIWGIFLFGLATVSLRKLFKT